MTERNVGRAWTDEEDQLLIDAVKQYGDVDKWKLVAHAVHGRSNKACRKRWLHSLCPTIKKTAWTAAEDEQLRLLFRKHGSKWAIIARHIPGRTDDACSKRYREALDPNLKKEDWTEEEDAQLMRIYDELGGKWGQVGQALNRSGLGCRNRWRLLERRKTSSSPFRHPPLAISESYIPYHPPDAYPSLSRDESSTSQAPEALPSPGPCIPQEMFLSPIPNIPHFHPASSSLSDALVCSPSCSQTTPEIREIHPTETTLLRSSLNCPSDPGSSNNIDIPNFSCLSALSHSTPTIFVEQTDDIFVPSIDNSPLFDPWDYDLMPGLDIDSPISTSSVSPITPTQFLSPTLHDNTLLSVDSLAADMFLSPHSSAHSEIYSPTNLFQLNLLPCINECSKTSLAFYTDDDDLSESLMEPLHITSPDVGSTTRFDLPSIELEFCDQVTPIEKSQRQVKKHAQSSSNARLSSILTVAPDPSIRPYACGHEDCWPANAVSGKSCFATSKELTDHNKEEHINYPGLRPFKCGLTSCGKSWKSVNGLQYHLQISTAHFQHAVSTKLAPAEESESAFDVNAAESTDRPKKLYRCNRSHCTKVYRQLSGLRYHMMHGHPPDLPTQLQVVPPTLARQIANKTGKKRKREELSSYAAVEWRP